MGPREGDEVGVEQRRRAPSRRRRRSRARTMVSSRVKPAERSVDRSRPRPARPPRRLAPATPGPRKTGGRTPRVMSLRIGRDAAVRRLELEPRILRAPVVQGEPGAEAEPVGEHHERPVEPDCPSVRKVDVVALVTRRPEPVPIRRGARILRRGIRRSSRGAGEPRRGARVRPPGPRRRAAEASPGDRCRRAGPGCSRVRSLRPPRTGASRGWGARGW